MEDSNLVTFFFYFYNFIEIQENIKWKKKGIKRKRGEEAKLQPVDNRKYELLKIVSSDFLWYGYNVVTFLIGLGVVSSFSL